MIKIVTIKLLFINSLLIFIMLGCSQDVEKVNLTPIITSFSPMFLDLDGGQTLTVNGWHFRRSDSFKVGNQFCTNVTFVNSQQITCTTPSSTTVISGKVSIIREESVITSSARKIRYAIVLGNDSSTDLNQALTNGLNSPRFVRKFDNKIMIATSNRINILSNHPNSNYPTFNGVIGQADNSTSVSFGPFSSINKFAGTPIHFDSDGARFAIADETNHRVLIWNKIPTNTDPADIVLGQPNFNSNTSNVDGVSARNLSSPRSVTFSGTKLIVADSGNHRVLIWNSLPTSNYQAADVVIGQSDFLSNQYNKTATTVPSASSLYTPTHATVIDGNLVISDSNNNRVLIFDGIPTANDTAADLVLGQSTFLTRTMNQGGIGADTLSDPRYVFSYGTKLYIADRKNHRVLIWNTFPDVNKKPADVVVGQPDFVTNSLDTTDEKFYYPLAVSVIDGKLYVSDTSNNRVLVFNTAPSTNGASADFVLGQPTMADSMPRNPNSPTKPGNVTTVSTDGFKLAVNDWDKHRVLLWNSIPTTNNTPPDLVLGQTDFSGYQKNSGTANGMNITFGSAITGSKLIVSDVGNNRVLIWNFWPTANNQAADVVLGQSNFTGSSANRGGAVSGITLSGPRGVWSDGTRLLISDTANHRVLLWNNFPADQSVPADVVIGQPNMTSSEENNGGLGPGTLSSPGTAKIIDNKLVIADSGNNRVLIYNSIPVTNGASADIVIGQSNFISDSYSIGEYTPNDGTFKPTDFAYIENGFYIIDNRLSRVLKYNSIPTTNGQAGVEIMGEGISQNILPKGENLASPYGIALANDYIFVADYTNGRVIITVE